MKRFTLDVPRLCRAMQRSRKELEYPCSMRAQLVRLFAGPRWSEEVSQDKREFVNLIALYVSIVGRSLIAKNPRVMLSTFDRALKPMVSAMQTWANQQIKRMKLANTLQRVVTDALFSVGICKVSLTTPAEAATASWGQGAGLPHAGLIDLDDWGYDSNARSFEECGFLFHRYRVPLDAVRDSDLYSKDRKNLTPTDRRRHNETGGDRTSALGTSGYGDVEEWQDMVDLWEVYLPRHRTVLTLASDDGGLPDGDQDPLREQAWVGPEAGPYHLLALGIVPGNALPKGPLQDLVDLHEAANRTFRKAVRMVDRVKENTFVQGGALEDGSRVMECDDGDVLRVDRPEAVQTRVTGGQALQPVFVMATQFRDLFSYFAGNLEMMGGLSPQSKTATQDRLLNENASRTVTDLQARTVDFTSEVVEALCWYWYNDPFLVQRSRHSLPGLPNVEIARAVTPAMRQRGRFEDLEIQVDPYSLQHSTPQERMQALNQVVQQIVIPMMQLLMQQGIAFDIHAWLRKIGQYMDMPDLAEIVTIQEPPAPATAGGPGGGGGPGMPAQTERRYVRESLPGRTRQGDDRNLVNAMLGVNTGGDPRRGRQPQLGGAA